MATSISIGCFRQDPEAPNLKQFNILLETVNLENERGHIFVVGIHFDKKRQTKKILCTAFKSNILYLRKRSCLIHLKNLLFNFLQLQ